MRIPLGRFAATVAALGLGFAAAAANAQDWRHGSTRGGVHDQQQHGGWTGDRDRGERRHSHDGVRHDRNGDGREDHWRHRDGRWDGHDRRDHRWGDGRWGDGRRDDHRRDDGGWRFGRDFGGDRDDNPPGPRGGPGTNWENPPGPAGGPGASPDRRRSGWRG